MHRPVTYRYTVRDLLDFEEKEIWQLRGKTKMELTFDNGEVIITDTVDVMISWYYWALANAYREIQITRDLFIDGKRFTDELHREMLYKAIASTQKLPDVDREDIWLLSYRDIYNRIYNAIAINLVEYMSSTTAVDALELLEDEEIMAVNAKVTDRQQSIDDAYAVIKNVVYGKRYERNPIVRSVINKTVKLPQILQSVGPRGRITDIDSVIFRKPIKRGFAMGFHDIIAFAKESRSAAKALLFNKDPVAIAEYFNRKLQLVCSVITHLVPGDCGTTNYTTINVPEGDEGRKMLRSLSGLYLRGEHDALYEIFPHMENLLGKSIEFRTSLNCRHAKHQGVCVTCYGTTSYAIPYDTNPGHVSCTAMCKDISQLIISTKHLDFIVHKFMVILRGKDATYLRTDKTQPENVYLKEQPKDSHVVMRFLTDEAKRLVDIKYVTQMNTYPITRASALTSAEFYVRDINNGLTDGSEVDLVRSATKASLSEEMLTYLREHGWRVEGNRTYVDLIDWNYRDPIFTYPLKHESMSEYGKRVETFIRSGNRTDDDEDLDVETNARRASSMLTAYSDPNAALMDAYTLISDKLHNIHMGHIATILLASRVNEAMSGDWTMPTSTLRGEFKTHDEIIRHRSLSVAMLYGWQMQVFNDLSCYLQRKRPTSVMDGLIHIPERRD